MTHGMCFPERQEQTLTRLSRVVPRLDDQFCTAQSLIHDLNNDGRFIPTATDAWFSNSRPVEYSTLALHHCPARPSYTFLPYVTPPTNPSLVLDTSATPWRFKVVDDYHRWHTALRPPRFGPTSVALHRSIAMSILKLPRISPSICAPKNLPTCCTISLLRPSYIQPFSSSQSHCQKRYCRHTLFFSFNSNHISLWDCIHSP